MKVQLIVFIICNIISCSLCVFVCMLSVCTCMSACTKLENKCAGTVSTADLDCFNYTLSGHLPDTQCPCNVSGRHPHPASSHLFWVSGQIVVPHPQLLRYDLLLNREPREITAFIPDIPGRHSVISVSFGNLLSYKWQCCFECFCLQQKSLYLAARNTKFVFHVQYRNKNRGGK